MELVLETGEGFVNSNSYIDRGHITQFMPSCNIGKWEALGVDSQVDALILACRFIDSTFMWKGVPRCFDQAMAFPRSGIVIHGRIHPDDKIPLKLIQACVMAVELILENGMDIFRDSGERLTQSEQIGPLKITFFDSEDNNGIKSAFSDINMLLKDYWFDKKSNVVSVGVLRK